MPLGCHYNITFDYLLAGCQKVIDFTLMLCPAGLLWWFLCSPCDIVKWRGPCHLESTLSLLPLCRSFLFLFSPLQVAGVPHNAERQCWEQALPTFILKKKHGVFGISHDWRIFASLLQGPLKSLPCSFLLLAF